MFSSGSFYSISFDSVSLFFFNDTATTEIYTLSLHDALPIAGNGQASGQPRAGGAGVALGSPRLRSEEHTSELQSLTNLVCRLLLEKKKKNTTTYITSTKTTTKQTT